MTEKDTHEMIRYKPTPWSRFVNAQNEKYMSEELFDLLDNLLQYDHQDRPTAKEAMEHPFFGNQKGSLNKCVLIFYYMISSHSKPNDTIINYDRIHPLSLSLFFSFLFFYPKPRFFFLLPGWGAPSTIFLSSTKAPSVETTTPNKVNFSFFHLFCLPWTISAIQ